MHTRRPAGARARLLHRVYHPDPLGLLGQRNAALVAPLGYHVARARATKQRTLGADQQDGCDALDSHRILNREPKLRLGDHRVGPGASGIDNPSLAGGEGDLLVQDRPRALPGTVLGPMSDSWHDQGWFRHRLGRGNAVGRPVVPQLLIGDRVPVGTRPTAPKQCALGPIGEIKSTCLPGVLSRSGWPQNPGRARGSAVGRPSSRFRQIGAR